MPNGKPAGVRCMQLSDLNQCMIFGKPERPAVCESLQPAREMCGETREYALQYLARLDELTSSSPAKEMPCNDDLPHSL